VAQAVAEIASLMKHASGVLLNPSVSLPSSALQIISDKAFDVYDNVNFDFSNEDEPGKE
jgi:hypothetical protein